MKIVVNDHIYLSEVRPSDQAACMEHFREKEIYDRTLRIPYPYTERNFQEWLTIVENSTKQLGQPVHWAIRNQQDYQIGGCGFDGLQSGQSHRAEIGYWLAKPYWGRGIMTAVVQRVCEYGFSEFGLVKIVAQVFPSNRASAAVLQKCGFQEEGYLRKHYLKDGQYHDSRQFALVNE